MYEPVYTDSRPAREHRVASQRVLKCMPACTIGKKQAVSHGTGAHSVCFISNVPQMDNIEMRAVLIIRILNNAQSFVHVNKLFAPNQQKKGNQPKALTSE